MNTHRFSPQKLLRRAADAIIPVTCSFCRSSGGKTICTACRKLLPWNEICCERCSQPLPALQNDGVLCAECQQRLPPYVLARAPLVYAFPVDEALKALKFKRHLWYVPAFSALLLPFLREDFAHCDALVPVPLYRWRQARRGFNQAFEICRPLRNSSGLRILTDVKRSKPTRSQTGLSAAERKKNLRSAFTLPDLLTCRHPLIVDDVITTGATVTQLAQILLRAGAESVSVLAVARARLS